MIAAQLLPHHKTDQGKTWEVTKYQVCVYNNLIRTGCQSQNLSLVAPFTVLLLPEAMHYLCGYKIIVGMYGYCFTVTCFCSKTWLPMRREMELTALLLNP